MNREKLADIIKRMQHPSQNEAVRAWANRLALLAAAPSRAGCECGRTEHVAAAILDSLYPGSKLETAEPGVVFAMMDAASAAIRALSDEAGQ